MARKPPPFMGKESKAEEASEKKKFPGKKAYAKAEAKFEGEKMPKFACGGKTKRYADGGDIPEGGRFDEDTYARARRFVESGGQSEDVDTPAAKPSVRRMAPTPAQKSAATPSPAPMAQYRPGTTTPADPDLPYANVGSRIFKTPAGAGRGTAGGPSAAQAVQGTRLDPRRDALEGSHPEALLIGGAGAGRAAASALRNMGKPATKAVAEIGSKVRPGVDEAMYARTGEVAKRAADAARIAAKRPPVGGTGRKGVDNPADTVRAQRASKSEAINKAMRSRSADDMYASGGAVKKAAAGGSVRGVGAAKRGFGRGKMC